MAAAIARVPAVFVGRAFEHRSLSFLQSRLSMTLTHVGSVGDGGVDLQGWWWVPRLDESKNKDRRPVRVLAQCKALKSKLGPIHVRELEGAALVHHHSFASDDQDLSVTTKPQELVAMVISLSGFTSNAVKRAMASPIPFLLLHLPAPESLPEGEETAEPLPITTPADSRSNSDSGSIVWNFKLAGASGLFGGHMEVRWALGQQQARQKEKIEGGRPVLYWKGKKLEHWVPETQEIGERFSGVY